MMKILLGSKYVTLGKVIKVESFKVDTRFGHGVIRSKHKLSLNVDSFDRVFKVGTQTRD